MSTQIRQNVFETNSSSSHSLTLNPEALRKLSYSKESYPEGIIDVIPKEFEWEWCRYADLTSKLSYMAVMYVNDYSTQLSYSFSELKEEFGDNAYVRAVKAIEEFTGLQVITYCNSFGSIDHQSRHKFNDTFDNMSEDALLSFLLDPNCWIQTGNDNDTPPSMIHNTATETEVPYYQYLEVAAPKTYPVVYLFKNEWDSELHIGQDRPIKDILSGADYQAFKEKGVIASVYQSITRSHRTAREYLGAVAERTRLHVDKAATLHQITNDEFVDGLFFKMRIGVKVPRKIYNQLMKAVNS